MYGLCRGLPQVCCGRDAVKIPTADCAGEPRWWCASLGSRRLRLHGPVVSLPFLFPREPPKIFLQQLVTRRLSAVWRRLGLCWFSQIAWGPTLFSLRQVMGLKTPVWRERGCFPKESEAPVIIPNIRGSLCRVSPPGILCWLSAQSSEQLRFSQFHFCPWQVCPLASQVSLWLEPPSPLQITAVSAGPQQSTPCCRVCCSEKGHVVLFTLHVRDS